MADGSQPDRASSLVARHGLWTDAQWDAFDRVPDVLDTAGVTLVRFSFVDQHGVLHGKTLTRDAVPGGLLNGVTVPSSLLLKDTSGRSVFDVFGADVGVGVEGFAGAGNVHLVADPATLRILGWASGTAWVLCDLHFADGSPVPFCTRGLLRRQLCGLAGRGWELTVGAELELHLFRAAEPGAPAPAAAPVPLTPGSQLLHEEGLDRLHDAVEALAAGLGSLDVGLRTIELEFGPSQLEITLAPAGALEAADRVALCRSSVRQICRRHGYHATFMARPAGSVSASVGWHLHQSLQSAGSGSELFAPEPGGDVLAPLGRHYLAGLLAHGPAATPFTTPTVNGYKRYQPYSLAPDRVVWGIENRGAMVRVVNGPDPAATRLENRSGEPAANPYLYVASQLISGLDGIDRQLDPGPPAAEPYAASAERLPRTLAAALDALDADPVFARALGEAVVAWYSTIKRAELERYLAHVSDWEQREYFDLF